MTKTLSFTGLAPLHDRPIERLQRWRAERGMGMVSVQAWYVLQSEFALDDEHCARIETLLQARLDRDAAIQQHALILGPRPGTQSPWSSKARDIFHLCGLTQVKRIEHYRRLDDFDAAKAPAELLKQLYDRMTEATFSSFDAVLKSLEDRAPGRMHSIAVLARGRAALTEANGELGLALSDAELAYLHQRFSELQRDPTDVELMMYAQANSEHCRHKIFNAEWLQDGVPTGFSLFQMIRNTHALHPNQVLVAYRDNAAVTQAFSAPRLLVAPAGDQVYRAENETQHLVAKVETHNHPTAVSPYPGAATGAGGEIRDEGATGRGARPKAGLTGFSVSPLRIPGYERSWEPVLPKSERQASPLEIMLQGPLGAAAYNNEFGRPALGGYFRCFASPRSTPSGSMLASHYGYHKPIMIAGGLGVIRAEHVQKQSAPAGSLLIVLGGPALLIGLGGGAASSMAAGSSTAELDFASVQRENPEMERRCQAVIDACIALGIDNPILSIHDVGAGGLSNALPELIHDCSGGGSIDFDAIPRAEAGLSPLELWCNEAQERYVLAVAPESRLLVQAICARERCPMAVVGELNDSGTLRARTQHELEPPVDLPMSLLLGGTPRMQRNLSLVPGDAPNFAAVVKDVKAVWLQVIQHPTVADKGFLVTIGDRSVGGQSVRDQLVGPWQLAVADCAVTVAGFEATTGEAMAMGERGPVARLNPIASARLAVTEALTNLAASRVLRLDQVILSANWMAAAGNPQEDAALYQAVEELGLRLCPALGINIPVGKDSLSMTTHIETAAGSAQVTAPMTVVITAFAPVADVRLTLTPWLQTEVASKLLLVRLNPTRPRLGASIMAEVLADPGGPTADLDHPQALVTFFRTVQLLNEQGLLLAYHDISDGGLAACLTEMALVSRSGLRIEIPGERDLIAELFAEEPGAVLQVREADVAAVLACLAELNVSILGTPTPELLLEVHHAGGVAVSLGLSELQAHWSEVSWQMRRLRDHPACADEEYQSLCDLTAPGLSVALPQALADLPVQTLAPSVVGIARPEVAILREQGVNGHLEMAAAFMAAGFTAVDVTMTDLIDGRVQLGRFHGLAACGGFSYGDVLGAGTGWAQTILCHPALEAAFAAFFADPARFALGVCNGCQMLSQLQSLIPGAERWPAFLPNRSQRFESRLLQVEVMASPSLFFQDMTGARLPIVVAHGEGRAAFRDSADAAQVAACLRYVDSHGLPSDRYPSNPNGSPGGVTAFTNDDGRVTILMPHPERCFRSVQLSWLPKDWRSPAGPWMQMFKNARHWLD